MKKITKISLLFGAIVILAVAFGIISFMQGYLGNSLKRISREHSVTLPSSSASGHNDGLVSMTWLGDFGATADFVLDAIQIKEFLGQLNEIKEGSAIKNKRLDWEYAVPEGFERELQYIEGVSKDGNVVTVTLYELDGKRVGVCLRTQWN